MTHLSIKARLTILYTGMMTLLVLIVISVLFAFGSQVILTDTKDLLQERVSSSFDHIRLQNEQFVYDSDLLQIEDGVYLSIYDTNGELLYGRLPYHFTYDLSFSIDELRRIDTDSLSYYVLDMTYLLDEEQPLIIRGVISITDAERNLHFILQIALILFPLFILISMIFGYLLSKRALTPVTQITKTVRQIQKDKDLSQRVKLGKGQDEIYTLAATFDELLERIEKLIQRERQFTSDVSHELRTPLSVMMMQCDSLLAQEDLRAETREQIERLQERVRALSSMIAQLLQLSRADQGREQLNKETFSISDLCETIAEEYAEIAAESRIQLLTQIEDGCMIHADQMLMIRMLNNLLQNAITYGKEDGHIWFSVYQDKQLIIKIKDDGIGISQKHLPLIWNRFFQADPSRSHFDSNGLGLSMVRWIVEAHDGTIDAESQLGHGTIFTLSFPLNQKTIKEEL